MRAVRLLPPEGAVVLLIDYGERGSFPARPDSLTIGAGELAEYECFGPSTMFRFSIGMRDLQAHVATGPRASDKTTDRAVAILAALTVNGQ